MGLFNILVKFRFLHWVYCSSDLNVYVDNLLVFGGVLKILYWSEDIVQETWGSATGCWIGSTWYVCNSL